MNANSSHAASDTIDSRIDRALTGLRDAQPRSGLNSRILAGLEHRSAAHATNPGGPSFHDFIVKGWGIVCGSKRESTFRPTHVALWAATSAAILAVASLLALHHSHPNKSAVILSANSKTVILSGAQRAQSKAGFPASILCSMGCKDPEIASVTTNTKPLSTTNLAQTASTSSSRPGLSSRHPERSAAERRTSVFGSCLDHHTTGCPIHDDAVVMSGPTQDPDAQALADLHAPSHPAPPLPLTAEEKLFLRMLRYGNATQLAELNPLVRDKEDADETAAFKAFFPDPPPLKQPLGDTE
ncbi:MAG TPA: hypothetical protein VGU25_00875 [Acidobacteriaceae bacterium]|nr:hypothetical protein [Acidobacteriaceae bacterium]